jgi:hypothetical protein
MEAYVPVSRSNVLDSTFCSAFLAAQTPDTAMLLGTVSDPSHAAVTGAHITVTAQLPPRSMQFSAKVSF